MAALILDFPIEHRAASFDPQPLTRKELRALLRRTLNIADDLVARLDALEGDADFEDGGDDEPSLAGPIGGASQAAWTAGGDRDLEKAS